MTTDYQVDLIRRIKVRLRQEAGLPSSFDTAGPSLPSLPTLGDAIAGCDPSPTELRCRKCGGQLLAGVRSSVCVYCGTHQWNGVLAPSISFTSTVACRRFLESLHLDGSEVVSLKTRRTDSTRCQSNTRKEIVLSELLNFELKLPISGTEKTDVSNGSNIKSPYSDYVNLGNVNGKDYINEANTEMITGRTIGRPISNFPVCNEIVTTRELFDIDKSVDSRSIVPSSWKAIFEPALYTNQSVDANAVSSYSPDSTSTVSNVPAATDEAAQETL